MTAPILWHTKLMLAKLESAYGTDPTPTGASNAILFTGQNVVLQPMEGQDIPRDVVRNYLGNPEMLPAGTYMTLAFDTEFAGSGAAGTAPPWGPLARGCALSETISAGVSVTYAPITINAESVTFYFWNGSNQYILKGCRGSLELGVDAEGVPKLSWKFTGLWTVPSEVAAATPTYTAWQTPLVANKTNTPTFTIGVVAAVLRSFKLMQANDVQYRSLIGRQEVILVDRKPEVSATIEALPMGTLNPASLANARTLQAIVLTHGITAGNILTVNAAKAQMQRPAAPTNNQDTVEWPLKWWARPNTGNDEFSVVCT